MPVASCRTPMSETYDMVGLPWGLSRGEMAVDWDLSASLTIVMGNPKKREKPIGVHYRLYTGDDGTTSKCHTDHLESGKEKIHDQQR